MIVVDLGAPEDKFVANSGPKTAEKTKLLSKLMSVQSVLLLPLFLDDPVEHVLYAVDCQTVKRVI